MTLSVAYAETKITPVSAVEKLLRNTTIETRDSTSTRYQQLALQISHNLRFQHSWTDLRLHDIVNERNGQHFYLISGMPPERLYVHPDEQIALLQQQKNEGKTGMPQLLAEREWVIPSHLREKWSLRRFGEIFDAVSIIPKPSDGRMIEFSESSEQIETVNTANPWRKTKRFLLATLDDDSTVVYYIVHDGLVKPRQN